MSRKGGIIFVNVNGELMDAKGNFSYNLGKPKREAIIGADKVHGYKETPQAAFVEGEITDRLTLDVARLVMMKDATLTLQLANGKTVVLRNAWYAADGNISTEEGNIQIRFEAADGEEIS